MELLTLLTLRDQRLMGHAVAMIFSVFLIVSSSNCMSITLHGALKQCGFICGGSRTSWLSQRIRKKWNRCHYNDKQFFSAGSGTTGLFRILCGLEVSRSHCSCCSAGNPTHRARNQWRQPLSDQRPACSRVPSWHRYFVPLSAQSVSSLKLISDCQIPCAVMTWIICEYTQWQCPLLSHRWNLLR